MKTRGRSLYSRRGGVCSEPPKLIAFASGNPMPSSRTKTMLLCFFTLSGTSCHLSQRARQTTSRVSLVGEGLAPPAQNNVTSLRNTSSAPSGHLPLRGRRGAWRIYSTLFVGTGVLDCPRKNDVTFLWNTSSVNRPRSIRLRPAVSF